MTVLIKGKSNIGYSGKSVVIGNIYFRYFTENNPIQGIGKTNNVPDLLTLDQDRLIMNMLMFELNGESKSWFHDF